MNNRSPSKSPETIWKEFLSNMSKQKPQPPAIYELIKDSQIAEINNTCLKIAFRSEEAKSAARAQLQAIKNRVPPELKRERLEFVVGFSPLVETIIQPVAPKAMTNSNPRFNPKQTSSSTELQNPLMQLLVTEFGRDREGREVAQPLLQQSSKADKICQGIYQLLTERTKYLAQETLTIQFPWRVRVGGMRGFRELLLPAFHPIYGIPYFPASSLKGAANAWARANGYEAEAKILFGTLRDGLGRVQILDAFPTKPCLSVDMANPQWHWRGESVEYKPEPHALLTLLKPEIVIGLLPTSRGTKDDIETVKKWLENALKTGIGSRVSAGYGRIDLTTILPYSSTYQFKLWSQGMHGANPPAKENSYQGEIEFRPVALRGILRYWFRTIALGLYSSTTCQELEQTLFGTLGQEGSIRIGMTWEKLGDSPLKIEGKILLESKSQEHLNLVQKILVLASHLSGVGRGARRPLHLNSGRLRGCHWELDGNVLPYNQTLWQTFLEEIMTSFRTIKSHETPGRCEPFRNSTRYQDVLNQNVSIVLVPSPNLKHPREVNNYSQGGDLSEVRGEALEVLYSSDKYKGRNRDGRGNEKVGGSLGVPSYVVIQSNYPSNSQKYQAVTIFGSDFRDRAAFKNEFTQDSISVWPLSSAPNKSNTPSKLAKPTISKKRSN